MGTLMRNSINYTGDISRELTLAEYKNLSEYEQNNGTYYIKDANLSGGVPNTAGTIKPYVYSEEETVVGVYEGKPLYRKTISANITSNVSWVSFDGKDTVDMLVTLNGTAINPSQSYPDIPIPFHGLDGYIEVGFARDNGILMRYSSNNLRTNYSLCYITIEYTKTTDAEGSGNSLMPYGYVDASLPFRFGIDENGNYGYYKDGADTVTPFKTSEPGIPLFNFKALTPTHLRLGTVSIVGEDSLRLSCGGGSTCVAYTSSNKIDFTNIKSVKISYSRTGQVDNWNGIALIDELPNKSDIEIPSISPNLPHVVRMPANSGEYVLDVSSVVGEHYLSIFVRDNTSVTAITFNITSLNFE